MDHLKSGIGLRGYAQVDPKIEYKREALVMFESMSMSIREEVTDLIFKIRIKPETIDRYKDVWHPDNFVYQDSENLVPEAPLTGKKRTESSGTSNQEEQKLEPIRIGSKVGRNQPCPCGSGKKFKQCCGK